jgi:hypothetical protein
MNNLILLVLVSSIIKSNAIVCSTFNFVYGNPDDYRSYYVCKNYCLSLEYCQPPTPYYSNNIPGCVKQRDTWIPRYYLSGVVTPEGSTKQMYVRQDGYQLLWAFDDLTTSETFIGQYINETRVQGIDTRRVLATNCINVFDTEVTATADRKYCATHKLHPQSDLCGRTYPYEFTYCRTLSF